MKNHKRIDRKKEYILIAIAFLLALYSIVSIVLKRKHIPAKPENPSSSQAVSAISTPEALSSLTPSALSAPPSKSPSPKSAPPSSSDPRTNPSAYQKLYPDLSVKKSKVAPPSQDKIVYLTFDDGPSKLTIPLLNVLDDYQVKATFFLIGKTDSADLKAMKEIVNRGHAVGVHSYTHIYDQIYANPVAFLDDFKKMHDLIQKTTGVNTHIYRFAGGSLNSHNKKTAKAIISEMNRRGFTYFDWNVESGDAETGTSAASIYQNAVTGASRNRQSVILFHNAAGKKSTLAEMPRIIETLKEQGYRFATLNDSLDNSSYIFKGKS